MSNEQIANYVVMIIVGGALAIGLISMLIGKIADITDWVRDQMAEAVARERANMSSNRAGDVPNNLVQNGHESPAPNRTNEPANLPNAALESGSPSLTSAFVLTPPEVAAIGRMIEHKATAEKPTKASTIWAGFAIKKGDSARYKRASEVYDALFILQPNFPELEATKQPRWESEQPA